MDAIAHMVTVALLALVPHVGPMEAKLYGDAVARASVEHRVDPWVIVAVGKVETNWNAANLGTCCGGLMSIHWPGWRRYAERHGLPSDRRAVRHMAQNGVLNIRVATQALGAWRRICGREPARYLGAYQSGVCRSNQYGRRVARVARRYRRQYTPGAHRYAHTQVRSVALTPVAYTLGTPGSPPGPTTAATASAGP